MKSLKWILLFTSIFIIPDVIYSQTIPVPISDCPAAQLLLNFDPISVPDGNWGPGNIQESASCFVGGEVASHWYVFYCTQPGTFNFSCTPNAAADYDFALFNITDSAPGNCNLSLSNQISCNYFLTSGVTGIGCGGVGCNPTINIVAGNLYALLINRYTIGSNVGYTLTFSGTALLGNPQNAINVNLIPTHTSCGLSNGLLNSVVSGGTPPYTFIWNNGATTSNLQNIAAGIYTITVTDNIGNSIVSSATINSSICPKVNSQSVSNVTQTTAVVTWPAVACATKYRIQLKKVGAATQSIIIVPSPNTSYILTNLTPNTTYQIRMRTQCSQNGTVLSQLLSPITTFTTLNNQGILCLPPTNISSANINANSVTINWTPSLGAIQYNLRYRKTGTSNWTTTIISNGSASSITLQNLTPASTYEYQIRSKCNNNPDEFSPYSALFTFTTAPLRIDEEVATFITVLYPNPTNGSVNLIINSTAETTATIIISDILGRVLQTETEELISGTNTITYNISNFAAGLYFIRISYGAETTTLKLIKE